MKLSVEQRAILGNQAFSREKSNLQALMTEVRRNKTMAISGTNKDFKKDHPDWIAQAQQKNFIDLESKTIQKVLKKQEIYQMRWERLHVTRKN